MCHWQTQKSSEINGGTEVCRKLDVAIRSTFEMEERIKAIVGRGDTASKRRRV